MLTLFPQYRIALGVGWLVTAAAAGWMLQSGAAWYWIVAMVLVCGFAALAIAELAAASQHQRLLMILYREGDPDRFIKAYEPLLSQRCTVPGRLLTLRAYLSNAYLAKGEFERAAQLLDEAPQVTGREAENARALLAGNRCTIALRSGNLPEAERQLRLLEEAQQRGRAEAKLFADLPLLREELAVRKGRPCEIGPIRTAAEKAVSPVRRADLLLELGMALSAQGKAKESELILRRAAGGNPALFSVRQAGALLAQLPVKTCKKMK